MVAAALYMLDTNIAPHPARTEPGPGSAIRSMPMAQVCVSSVTQGELLYGFLCWLGATALQTVVREFLRRVDVLAWDSAAATRYGALRAALEAGGTPLGNLDTLIAAHALSLDAILVTNDQAFARVPDLVVENWASP